MFEVEVLCLTRSQIIPILTSKTPNNRNPGFPPMFEALQQLLASLRIIKNQQFILNDTWWLTMAPGSASSSPKAKAKLLTAFVTSSTVIFSL